MWLETSVTTRLPSTGPRVQKPIAVPRPTCGEKSRISAGVATRTMPSTRLRTANSTVYTVLFGAFGRPKAMISPVSSRPPTTRLARPQRSARPANSEANAPTALPITETNTKYVNVMWNSAMIWVATAPAM